MRDHSTSGGQGWPLVALGALLWGTDLVLRPTLLKHPGFSAVRVVLYEHLALALIFLPLLIVKRADWGGISKREWASLIYIAWAGSAVATVLLSLAYQLGVGYNGALTATLLQKTQPVFAIVLAGLLLGERRQPLFWLLFACAMTATYLLSFGIASPLVALRGPRAASVGCALGAAFLWGSCTVIGRQALAAMSPSTVAAWRFVLAVPLLLAINAAALLSPSSHHFSAHFQPAAVLLLIGIVLFPDVAGMVLYYAGLRSTPASQATLAELAYPISAMILGAVLLHQKLLLGQLIGILALIVILPLIQWSHSVRAPQPRESEDNRIEPLNLIEASG